MAIVALVCCRQIEYTKLTNFILSNSNGQTNKKEHWEKLIFVYNDKYEHGKYAKPFRCIESILVVSLMFQMKSKNCVKLCPQKLSLYFPPSIFELWYLNTNYIY